MLEAAVQPLEVPRPAVFKARATTAHLRWLSFVLFYTVAANIPYWVSARVLGLMPLGWFCTEYAIVGLLAMYLPRVATAMLLLIVIAGDILSGISKTYYVAPADCLANLSAVGDVSHVRLVLLAGVLVLITCVVAISMYLPSKEIAGADRRHAAFVFVALLICTGLADFASKSHGIMQVPKLSGSSSRSNDFRPQSSLAITWIARYPAMRLLREELILVRAPHVILGSFDHAQQMNGAANAALHYVQLQSSGPSAAPPIVSSLPPNIVLILAESWGLALDHHLRDGLTDPYRQSSLLARYSVTQGTTNFRGPTIAGEARELCNSSIGSGIISVSQQNFNTCMPERLRALGYRTIAVHGMDGHMFQRIDWYKRAGFDEQWFRDDLRQQGLPQCLGAFTGVCDSAIAKWLGTRLVHAQSQPQFIYWVTLNSHLPVPVPTALRYPASCALTPQLTSEPALCSWFQLITNVHQSVATLAQSSLSRPTIFVVVGDHAPPFANPDLRSQFSQDVVPWVILTPRAGTAPANESVQLAMRDQSSH